MGSISHGKKCNLLYMKFICCKDFTEIHAQLEEVGGVNLSWVDVHSAIYETYLV